MKRQPLYACLTCLPVNPDPSSTPVVAGVCLACSYNCHEGCQLVELYTKRNFRCDCGNGKFGDKFTCKLEPKKAKSNVDNRFEASFS